MVSPAGPNLGVLTDPVRLLVTAAQPANVDTVLVEGQVLKRAGTLIGLDTARIRHDAHEALGGVLARASGRFTR